MKPGDIIVRSAGNRPMQVMSVFGPQIRAAYCGLSFQHRVETGSIAHLKESLCRLVTDLKMINGDTSRLNAKQMEQLQKQLLPTNETHEEEKLMPANRLKLPSRLSTGIISKG